MFKKIKAFFKGIKDIFDTEANSYAEAISYMADRRTKFQFTCSGSKNVSIVMSNIFRIANYYVCILAKDLTGEVSDHNYLFWLKEFLKKDNTKLDIILEHDISFYVTKSIVVSYLIKQLQKKPKLKNRIRILCIKDMTVLNDIGTHSIIHFSVADDKMYVMQLAPDRTSHICIGNFNDEEKAKELKESFHSIITQELKCL